MNKKKALFHAIVTAIIVSIIIGITACVVYGIASLMERLYEAGFHLLAFILPLLLIIVIVAIKAYRYFRKKY